jgi:hypothetical protein
MSPADQDRMKDMISTVDDPCLDAGSQEKSGKMEIHNKLKMDGGGLYVEEARTCMSNLNDGLGDELVAEEDSEQTRKWEEFLKGDASQFTVDGIDLLKAMEHFDEEVVESETDVEPIEKMELNSMVVNQIKAAREKEPKMGVCPHGKKPG